jgi:ubiquinone/menaquinone biosynthesis C-methylase UbiE
MVSKTNIPIPLLSNPAHFAKQSASYLKVRKQEAWLYPDEMALLLPQVPARHPHARLWRWRRRGLNHLLSYLTKTYADRPINILDVGCGNGWMTHFLAKNLKNAQVLGVDVNLTELEQANRVFQLPNLQFAFADLTEGVLPENHFDMVLFAGSFQYFPDVSRILNSVKTVLKSPGALHIIDTNFYPNEESRTRARKATKQYYETMGVPEMAAFYHHYLRSEIPGVDRRNHLKDRFLQKIGYLSPFPWMQITF